MKYTECELCGKIVSNSNYNRHLQSHSTHPEYYIQPKYRLNHEGLICQFCGDECKNRNSLCNHERLCKENPNRQLTSFEKTGKSNFDYYNQQMANGERKVWNYGLTKETDERLKQQGETYSKHYREGLFEFYNPLSNEEYRIKHKQSMKQVYAQKVQDGEYHTSGHKCGWYKDFWCDSSWELAYVIYCLDNDIKIERNHTGFDYVYEDEHHTYFPDFYLPDSNTYIEIKGYQTDRDVAKHVQFKESLQVLQEEQIKPILEHVRSTYGDDFIRLYESK